MNPEAVPLPASRTPRTPRTATVEIVVPVYNEAEELASSVERLDDRVRVSIIDRGPGIPQAFQAQVFERFAQARSSAAKSSVGVKSPRLIK